MGAAAAAAAGAAGVRLRPLLGAAAVVAAAALVYVLVLSLAVAAALSRLSTVHNSAAEYSLVYWGMPYLFARRRGAVPGAAVPQRRARFDAAFPARSQTAARPRVQCAICIEDVRAGHLKRTLNCRHEFHKSCIDRWLDKGANRCPLCNMECLPTSL